VNTLRLTGVQIRYVNKAFWRNPASAFFTFAFPLMFLVIFTALLGHYTIHLGSRTVYTSTYYVASMACFSVITACFNNIATAVSFQREDGILKRAHGTPLPGASFLGARILHAILVAVLLVAITAAFGRLVYSADIPTGLSLLRFVVALLVGAAAFCALGLAATAVIPNSDAAAPIINAIILPIRHFVLSMQSAFLGAAFSWTDVLIVAAWGIAGVLLAIRFFTWEPRQG
jgi:ABC-2 type transport system permease protein